MRRPQAREGKARPRSRPPAGRSTRLGLGPAPRVRARRRSGPTRPKQMYCLLASRRPWPVDSREMRTFLILSLFVVGLLSAAGLSAQVAIQVRADAPGDDERNLNGEYVLVSNEGTTPVELDGWRLCDAVLDCFVFVPRSRRRPAGLHRIGTAHAARPIHESRSSALGELVRHRDTDRPGRRGPRPVRLGPGAGAGLRPAVMAPRGAIRLPGDQPLRLSPTPTYRMSSR